MEAVAYIESGMLELFAVGQLADKELREMECMFAACPEVRAEYIEISNALAVYATAFRRLPPPSLRRNVLALLARPSETRLSGRSLDLQYHY